MSVSPITANKAMQGYQGAIGRNRCGNCQHVAKVDNDTLQCRKGGFFVTNFAYCRVWEVKQPPGFRPPTNATALQPGQEGRNPVPNRPTSEGQGIGAAGSKNAASGL